MIFSALDKLLISDRPADQLVFFSAQNTKNWCDFMTDVALLCEYLNEQPALRWAICCENSYLFSVAFFAAAYSNKKLVLPGNHQPEMLKLLAQQFDGLLSDSHVLNQRQVQQCLLPLISEKIPKPITHPLDINTVSLILFTSGTSGAPKAIHKTLALLDIEIQSLEKQWGQLLQQTQIVSSVSHQHIYGLLFRVLWPLCAGRAIQSTDLTYPEQMIKTANINTTLISSPALLKRLTDSNDGSGYRAVFSSGGALSYEAALTSHKCLKQLPIEVYGSTETGGIAHRQQRSEQATWHFFSSIQATLDSQGCLQIKSDWIDQSGYYQTSDLCELLDNQQFILKGRVDRIVKIEEKRVSLTEVEIHILELPWIEDSAVILLNHQARLCLGAVITLTPQGIQEVEKIGKGQFWLLLRQQLRLWIEPVGIPKYFRVVNEIPVNAQGKRLHNELSNLFNNKSEEVNAVT